MPLGKNLNPSIQPVHDHAYGHFFFRKQLDPTFTVRGKVPLFKHEVVSTAVNNLPFQKPHATEQSFLEAMAFAASESVYILIWLAAHLVEQTGFRPADDSG